MRVINLDKSYASDSLNTRDKTTLNDIRSEQLIEPPSRIKLFIPRPNSLVPHALFICLHRCDFVPATPCCSWLSAWSIVLSSLRCSSLFWLVVIAVVAVVAVAVVVGCCWVYSVRRWCPGGLVAPLDFRCRIYFQFGVERDVEVLKIRKDYSFDDEFSFLLTEWQSKVSSLAFSKNGHSSFFPKT